MEAVRILIVISTIIFQILLLPLYWLNAIWCAIFDGEGKKLNGKIIMVTGAGNGLGRELTLQLVSQGALVLAVDIREEDLEDTIKMAEEITKSKGCVQPFICDISDRKAVANLRDAVLKDHGYLDILINNAAILYNGHFESGEDTHIESIVNTNILGFLWMTRAFLPSMKSRENGHIVLISSVAAVLPHKDLCIYSATKSAVTALGVCLRQSLESQKRFENIKVTTIHPSFIETSFLVKEAVKSVPVTPMSCEYAALSIINAIRNEYADVLLPGGENAFALIHIVQTLPRKLRNIIYETFQIQFGKETYESFFEELVNDKTSYRTLEKRTQ